MKYLFVIFSLLILSGCSASAKYDFDLSCPTDNIKISAGDGETTYGCTEKYFNVLCVANTVTYIGSDLYCTTHDKKSVRIRLIIKK
jgi:hypothetical protein